jgi:outer membrane biosynthesis protein TonB
LEKSLRADIEAYLKSRMGGLKEEVERLRGQFDEALARLSERIDEPVSADAPVAVSVAEHLRNARNLGIEAAAEGSARARASSDIALIKAAVDEIEGHQTQGEVLNALVNRSAAFAPRVAFFVVKGGRATGWRARGLEGTVGDDSVRELSMPVESDTLLGSVVRSGSTWAGDPGAHAEDHTIYNHFGGDPPQRIVAVPLTARGKVVAVLYADSAGQDADAVNLEAIEALVRVAGMAVELQAARRSKEAPAAEPAPAARQEQPTQAEPQSQPTHAPTEAERAPQREAEQPPQPSHQAEPTPAHEPQPAYEPQPEHTFAAAPQQQPSSVAEPETQSSFTAQQQREPEQPAPQPSPESQPTPSFAPQAGSSFSPSVVGQGGASASDASASSVSPLGRSRRYGSMDMDFPVEVTEDEKRYHNEARRFARLLVSEIKLYNEQKVRDGRDAGDLYDRLREDIDRSRQMYDKRVRPEVSNRYDYFHHELVQMLAEGDPSKLGADYPGASA